MSLMERYQKAMNDKNEDEITLFTFENEFIWDE